MLTALLSLMFMDMVSGLLVAAARKKLNSTVSWRGACRKVMMLLLVGAGVVIQPWCGGIPTGNLICILYIVGEMISITENAASLGVPLPKALVDTLEKMRDTNQKQIVNSRQTVKAEVKLELEDKPQSGTSDHPELNVEPGTVVDPKKIAPMVIAAATVVLLK